ncbi:MAG TPA: hypothetical protein VKT32_04880, partial [Chthonomonadaceae bacterium]|nr:hypothetical protein [Chthonomonadaceae bacterium]
MRISLSRHPAGLLAGVSLGLAAVCLAAAPRPSVPEKVLAVDKTLISEERGSSEVLDNLEYLSDIIGPRLTGSENLRRANDWTAEKMRQYGLENVHLEPYTIPRGWERGPVV